MFHHVLSHQTNIVQSSQETSSYQPYLNDTQIIFYWKCFMCICTCNTWSGFKAVQPTPWSETLPFSRFIQPYDGLADQGCCCFLTLTYILLLGNSCKNLLSSNLNFSVLTLLMSLRYLCNELYKHGPSMVIPFSWMYCT